MGKKRSREQRRKWERKRRETARRGLGVITRILCLLCVFVLDSDLIFTVYLVIKEKILNPFQKISNVHKALSLLKNKQASKQTQATRRSLNSPFPIVILFLSVLSNFLEKLPPSCLPFTSSTY